jgi:mRNA interferase MazF
VLSRPAAIELLESVIVAPISSTIHGVPSEVLLGESHGLKRTSAANLDNVQTIRKSGLTHFLGHVDEATLARVCQALAIATGCGAPPPAARV